MWGATRFHLLFSLYINDLPLHTKFHVHLFADDTVLMMKDKNISNLQIAVNRELCDVDNWMRYNRLSLNFFKSSFFISTTKYKKILRIISVLMSAVIPYHAKNRLNMLGIG